MKTNKRERNCSKSGNNISILSRHAILDDVILEEDNTLTHEDEVEGSARTGIFPSLPSNVQFNNINSESPNYANRIQNIRYGNHSSMTESKDVNV